MNQPKAAFSASFAKCALVVFGYDCSPLTEAHFYGDRYAITNNTSVEQTTIFYDMDGALQELTLKPYEIKWIVV